MTHPPSQTEILIVGGGPTGLTAGIELASRGIDCVILEPRTSVSHLTPRAKTTNIRSMEHFRRLGVAERIRDAANIPLEWDQDAVFCTSLLGHEICRLDHILGLEPGQSEDFAEPGQQIPQPLVEETLRERVEELPSATFATGWRLEALSQTEAQVEATAVGEDRRQEIVADYAIGSDGAKSTVRDEIGATYLGDGNPRKNLGIVFTAPELDELQSHGRAVHYWVINESVQGLVGRLDLEETWWAIAVGVDTSDYPSTESLLDELVGESVEMEVLGTDPWSSRMLVVDDARKARVFLAGDAAVLNPPWGGLGYNTGVADAVDIGWKLAAVTNGWAGIDLLGSYEPERRPVWNRILEETTANMNSAPADLVVPDIAAPGENGQAAREEAAAHIREVKPREFYSHGIVLGYRYDGSPVIAEDDRNPPPKDVVDYVPSTYPGCRLPHAWLGEDHSLYDELGAGFSLVRLDTDIEVEPLLSEARDRGFPLDLVDVESSASLRRYEESLLLVRPDQHVAWRGESCPARPAHLLDLVSGRR